MVVQAAATLELVSLPSVPAAAGSPLSPATAPAALFERVEPLGARPLPVAAVPAVLRSSQNAGMPPGESGVILNGERENKEAGTIGQYPGGAVAGGIKRLGLHGAGPAPGPGRCRAACARRAGRRWS